MKPELGFVNLLSTENVLDDLAFAAANGFKWFELALDWKQNFNLPDKTLDKIRDRAKDEGIRLIVHTPFYLPTSALLPEIKKGLLEYVEKAVRLAEHINSDRMTFHSGWREMPGPNTDLCLESLIENLRSIVATGEEYNVNICLENSPEYALVLCDNLRDYLHVLDAVNDIKVTLDVGHAHTSSSSPEEYLCDVKDMIMDMHIHDNMGELDEHQCPGQGTLNFESLLAECKKWGYSGPFTLELFPYENILKGKEVFIELWGKE